MATKKTVTESTRGALVSATKVKAGGCKKTRAKKPLDKAEACGKTSTRAKNCCTKRATSKNASKKVLKEKLEIEHTGIDEQNHEVQACGYTERRAQRVELADVNDTTVSVETMKIGLLLAAIDGHCDNDEIAKFKKVAKSCGGLSPAKVNQIITQTKRRISVLEEAARNGATEDEMVKNFISEASNIGIQMNCRNFVVWMSIAMVDGDFSSVERKAIIALRDRAQKMYHGFGVLNFQKKDSDVSDLFLKRCEMILAGIYKADAAGSKRLLQNRMKSLQTLVEIADA